MYKTYIITFINKENKRSRIANVPARSEAEARRVFHECYRHGDYAILRITEV